MAQMFGKMTINVPADCSSGRIYIQYQVVLSNSAINNQAFANRKQSKTFHEKALK
jgi:hypothetical protein